MTAHKHAHLMMQYAQDALEMDKPWKRWEILLCDKGWVKCEYHPQWVAENEYRRKPQTITIAGIEVPKPVSEPLKDGRFYYYPTSINPDLAERSYWEGDKWDRMRLKANQIHLDKESAIIHAKALIKASGGEV